MLYVLLAFDLNQNFSANIFSTLLQKLFIMITVWDIAMQCQAKTSRVWIAAFHLNF